MGDGLFHGELEVGSSRLVVEVVGRDEELRGRDLAPRERPGWPSETPHQKRGAISRLLLGEESVVKRHESELSCRRSSRTIDTALRVRAINVFRPQTDLITQVAGEDGLVVRSSQVTRAALGQKSLGQNVEASARDTEPACEVAGVHIPQLRKRPE